MSSVASSGRPRRGSLDILPNLPLDLLGEIFSCLGPTDLLALTRTSRTFRCFLLAGSATFIWRSARQNVVGLPEPPSDMNEIQYAYLVFGSRCHYEGCDRKARDTVWHLRIRSCARCRPKHKPVKLENGRDIDILAISGILPFPATLEQYIPCGPFLNSKGKSIRGFQASHIKTFKDELMALPPSEHQAYLDRCRQATEVVSRFSSAGVEWQLNVKNLYLTEMRNKRTARAETIRECLAKTSFQEEIDYFGWDRIRKYSLISNTQEITDQARSNVVDQLEDYMLGWRELRMEEQVYDARRKLFVDAWLQYTTAVFYNAPSNSPYLPLPPTSTVGLSESIDSIIRQSTPTSQDSLLQQFQAAFLPACAYILEWHRTVRRELASLLPDYRTENNDETIHAQLKLATSVFQCTCRNCHADGRTLTYPEILFHPCFTRQTEESGSSFKSPRVTAKQQACLAMGGSPWRCRGRVRVHPKQDVVNSIIVCFRKDPRSTTATEMDMEIPRLVCLECGTRDRVIQFLTWRRAVQHHIMSHPNTTLKHPWFVTGPMSRVRIDMLQPPALRPFSNVMVGKLSSYSICLRCPPRIPSWNTSLGFKGLINHVQKKHGIPTPELRRDYTFDTNITPLYWDQGYQGSCSVPLRV